MDLSEKLKVARTTLNLTLETVSERALGLAFRRFPSLRTVAVNLA